MGDSNVVLSFVGWIDQTRTDFQKARSEAMRLVKLALEANGFSLPEPIYRLRFDDAPALENLLADRGRPDREQRKIASKETVFPETVEEVLNDTEADRDLERQVDQERRAAQSEDLLDEDAPKEFGAKSAKLS